MRAHTGFSRIVLVAFAAVGFASSAVYSQQDSAQPQKTGANNEPFKTLRTRCETEISCGKASGDICADAAALLLGNDFPDEFREMNEAQRVKIALRLLERGVDSSNLARGMAYDWYSKSDMLNLGGYSDSYRANELMEMMIRSSYPGAALRKARNALSFFSFGASAEEKQAACVLARTLKAGGKLDADSSRIANELLENVNCNAAQNRN